MERIFVDGALCLTRPRTLLWTVAVVREDLGGGTRLFLCKDLSMAICRFMVWFAKT